MIENIYSEKNTQDQVTGVNSKLRIPKNVRQIGRIGDGVKIYVEDYVKTFTRQMTENDYSGRSVAILVGEHKRTGSERCLFIYGAIRTEEVCSGDKLHFTEDTWTKVYETIKKYFPDGEITGWYYGGTSFGMEELDMLKSVHIDNFAGRDKLLYVYDVIEKEELFYQFENNELVPQPGYYIYYEKNEEMQNYMVDHKLQKKIEEEVDDHAVQDMRTKLLDKKQAIMQEKIELEKAKKGKDIKIDQKNMMRLLYAAGSLMTIVALAVGISVMNNYQKMKDMEDALNTISGNIFDKSPTPTGGAGITPTGPAPTSIKQTDSDKDGGGDKKQSDEKENDSQTDKKEEEENQNGIAKNDKDSKITPEPTKEVGGDTEEKVPTDKPKISDTPKEPKPSNTPVPTKKPENNETGQTPDKDSGETTSTNDLSSYKIYAVKTGDTMVGICFRLYGDLSNLDHICEINQLVDQDKIFIGQELLVP